MSNAYSPVVKTAQAYYNSDDADNFYFHIWGGEDIHIGIYASDDESIAAASERTVASMAERVGGVAAETRVLDIGAGYGGAARWLARRFGWQVACLNLSEAQNARNRELSAAQGLAEHVTVIDGNFESIPAADAAYDLVWSQDAILHSGRRAQVLQEIDRVLVPGGEFLFTDPMQADACPAGVLQPVLERIHLDSLGSFAFYRQQAAALGWEEVGIVDLTPQLPTHYARVRRDLEARRRELAGLVSEAYIERMLQGLGHWVEAGSNGYLAWGILHFRKPR